MQKSKSCRYFTFEHNENDSQFHVKIGFEAAEPELAFLGEPWPVKSAQLSNHNYLRAIGMDEPCNRDFFGPQKVEIFRAHPFR
jgi:hypothetical protein